MNAATQVADSLRRAQLCWDRINDTVHEAGMPFREATALFLNHITTAVLLEHVRRLDPDLADQLTAWMLTEDGIFSDGYAGELLYQWRQQLAAGQPLNPIGPDPERTA